MVEAHLTIKVVPYTGRRRSDCSELITVVDRCAGRRVVGCAFSR